MKISRLAAVLLFGLVPTGLLAHDAGGIEHIQNFDSNITVKRDNSLDITETIKYDFGGNSRHGIYRTIPLSYPATDGKSYFIELNAVSVLQDGGSVPVDQSNSSDNAVLKIGDPNILVSGVHDYTIHYRLAPIIISYKDKPFLNLDITGNDWDVAIEQASATINLEDGSKLIDAACYAGASGASTQDCISKDNRFSASNLLVKHGLTVNAFLPDGYVAKYLVATTFPPIAWWAWLLIIGIPLFLILAMMRWAGRRWRERRRKSKQTIIPQYEPPDGLTPGEIGFLHDDSANVVEITATLIDLAVRGYIRIVQTKKKTLFRKAKYRLQQLKNFSGVADYEETLLNAIFRGESLEVTSKIVDKGQAINVMQEVDVDKIDKMKMSLAVTKIKKTLKDRLANKGYYGITKMEKGLLEKAIDGGNISDEGAAAWARAEGLKLYLGVAEKDRLKFTDAPERTPERFNKLLPYAVAMGVEKEWAKQFEGIDIASQSTWFNSPYGTWTAFNLADDLGSGFSPTISASSSYASSSGGSSGGGFGGGGGGSW